jgi:hypothetical protein
MAESARRCLALRDRVIGDVGGDAVGSKCFSFGGMFWARLLSIQHEAVAVEVGGHELNFESGAN